ncbi:MAG TPA: Grx4 family monothiol glutaredoxin [Mariprofundaceae bacterium]|nr:Grx4 family monothiol glutaredoxin [Mariprofundaceae bacterium]
MNDPVLEQIDKVIKENDIVLFMKGTPDFPQCGFSQRTAAIVASYGVPFAAVNVLLDPAIREGIKTYSDWPTLPQLYIKGEFIGGCDIVTEMQESGELEALMKPLQEAGRA